MTDTFIDDIYDTVEELLKSSRFDTIDAILAQMAVRSAVIDTDTIITWLTATLPAKSKLPSRGRFFAAAESAINLRGQWEPGLLDGLE